MEEHLAGNEGDGNFCKESKIIAVVMVIEKNVK